jgi:hypothetical protein
MGVMTPKPARTVIAADTTAAPSARAQRVRRGIHAMFRIAVSLGWRSSIDSSGDDGARPQSGKRENALRLQSFWRCLPACARWVRAPPPVD